MPSLVIVGLQFGDEGKGKIVDFLVEKLKISHVVRFNGGNNAGHTVVVGDEKFKLHHIPSGVIQGKECLLGNGMAIDPKVLIDELNGLKQRGINPKLTISPLAHVITEKHKELDAADSKIGTTKRGIGPAYASKISRNGIRMGDLKSAYSNYSNELSKYIGDVSLKVNAALDNKKAVLFEGAQGTLLDIDFGTYPFVTSSNTIAGGACTGAGVSPKRINKVIGVAKAYTTRVGSGPFPTELSDEIGEKIRKQGAEFGTTTGRPRRCGWLDILMLNYSIRLSGVDEIALTKLDVLSGLEETKICTSYSYNGETLREFPSDSKVLSECRPVYETLKGWPEFKQGDFAKTKFDKLPKEVKNYISRVEKLTGAPISIISFGPERGDTYIKGKLSL